jgi:hypothetical protein
MVNERRNPVLAAAIEKAAREPGVGRRGPRRDLASESPAKQVFDTGP